ncbi:MAG TPA: hypothetical protein VGQ30_09290 [Gemmatimonadaceae bacterium]|nr:hypothetical protein [Gemmatimonadaceae bacterium]
MIAAEPPDKRERVAAFVVIALVFIAIVQPELHYVPIWDGRVYANCAIEAASNGVAGLSMESLRCAGHPSQGYVIFLAASQLLSFGNITALHLTNVMLGILALFSIRVVLGRIIPDPARQRQLDLVTLLCAIHPVVLSTLLQVNVDFGVYVFFYATLAALMSGKYWLATFTGLLLCFSKETGVLAYVLMIGLDVVFRVLPAGTAAERAKRALPLWMTPLPVLLFGAHVLWWNATHARPAVWKHTWQTGTIDGFRFFDLSDPVFLSYAAGIFIIGFMWVVSLIIGADLVWGGVRMVKRLPPREVKSADMHRLAYFTVLAVALIYLLTSFRTWSNLRYFALLYPMLVILAFAAMLRLGWGWRSRTLSLVAIGALFALSIYRSVDPLAQAVYGTFSTGLHDMYRMSSITKEYDGPGRDEIVYNFQFIGYHHAQNALFRALQPTDSTAFATSRIARYNIWSQLDVATRERTMSQQNVIVPRYWDDVDLLASPKRPREVWFLVFTYFPDHDTTLASLKTLYKETGLTRTMSRGHLILAHHLELISP